MSPEVPEIPKSGSTAAERMDRTLELLEVRDAVTVVELAQVFSVSEVTVRSDLSNLARQGLVARFAAARARCNRGSRRRRSTSGSECRRKPSAQSRALRAQWSATARRSLSTRAPPPSTSRSSCGTKQELVVVTNGLRIAGALADAPGVSVIVPGGVLRYAAMSLVGDFASGVLRRRVSARASSARAGSAPIAG